MKLKTKNDISTLIKRSPKHWAHLKAVREYGPPGAWIAAGFVRNLVWDHLHSYKRPTPLNDIDIIYFDPDNLDGTIEKRCEQKLSEIFPGESWSVKNQARMHIKNRDKPYKTIEEALCHWCETPTPIGARLNDTGDIEFLAPLGVDDLINGICRATPLTKKRPHKLTQYRERIQSKEWQTLWPDLVIYDMNDNEDLKTA